jgi:hypothetical protein
VLGRCWSCPEPGCPRHARFAEQVGRVFQAYVQPGGVPYRSLDMRCSFLPRGPRAVEMGIGRQDIADDPGSRTEMTLPRLSSTPAGR